MNGKDSKNGMDGEKGKNKYSIFDLSFHMMNLLKVRGPSVIFCCEKLHSRNFFVEEIRLQAKNDSLASDGR